MTSSPLDNGRISLIHIPEITLLEGSDRSDTEEDGCILKAEEAAILHELEEAISNHDIYNDLSSPTTPLWHFNLDTHLNEPFTFRGRDSPVPSPKGSLKATGKQSTVANQMLRLITKATVVVDDKQGQNGPTTQGEKFLVQIREGNLDAIRKTLDQSPEVIYFSDPYGVTGLMMAIDKGNNELTKFLIERGADVSAFSKTFQKETSLSRAAKLQNKPIVCLLVEKGAEIQVALNCICNPQIGSDWVNDEKAFSLTGVKLLVSPQILAATREPILTAFTVSDKLYSLAKRREEYRDIYTDLAIESEAFAYHFLDQCENLWEARRILSKEMNIIDKAISGSKKEFVAHPFVQSLLKEQNFGKFMNQSLWGSTVLFMKWLFSVPILFPYYGILYLNTGKHRKLKYSYLGDHIEFMGTPLLCLIADTITYMICFSMLLVICTREKLPIYPSEFVMGYEYILWACIVGQIYTEMIQVRKLGLKNYMTHFWNLMDVTIIVLLFCAAGCRLWVLLTIDNLRSSDDYKALSDDVFLDQIAPTIASYQASAGILYGVLGFVQTIKFLSITDASYVLGPLQLAMKSMMRDLMLIFIMLSIIILAFSISIYVIMHQIPILYGKQIVTENTVLEENFNNLGQTIATLFWALLGFIDFIADMRKEETGKPEIYALFYIFFAGYLMMSTVLLLNMLIAMLTTTFDRIQHQSDVEWKFARSMMYRGYMGGQSFPSPFNLICHALIIAFSKIFRCTTKPLLGQSRHNDAQDQYREKLIKDLRKRYYVDRSMAVGKKVGGLVEQYNTMLQGRTYSDSISTGKLPSVSKPDKALTALQQGDLKKR